MKKSLLSGYLAQGYSSLVGLLLMPYYLRLMGAEAFGLIGIFLMLQGWVQLLDLGLTPTFAREVARFRANAIDAATAWRFVRGMEWLQGTTAIACAVLLSLASGWIAAHWLHARQLSNADVAASLVMIIVAACLRWLAGMHRAGLVGLERQHWVNAATAIFVTLRFVGVVPVLLFVSRTPMAFFLWQMAISGLEFVAFRREFHASLPRAPGAGGSRFAGLRDILPLAGAMALLTSLWIVQTQADKLILSKVLSLASYGNFTLAMMVAGGMLMLLPPLQQVVQPRLTILVAQDRGEEIRELYSMATQFAAVLFVAIGVTIALFARPLLFAWTGNAAAADAAAPILFWYGPANAIIGLLSLPFMLQFARGSLRMQLFASMAVALCLLPLLVYLSLTRGAVGAGQALFAVNLANLLVWIPYVHRHLGMTAGRGWLRQDVLPIAGAVLVPSLLVYYGLPMPATRWEGGVMAMLAFGASIACGVLAGSKSRPFFLAHVGRLA